MEKTENKSRFGLIGKNIDYSFSRGYFTQKFKDLKLDNFSYENFDFQHIDELHSVLKNEKNIKGFNTDYFGFQKAIEPCIKKHHKSALILGTGGASKAVAFVLKELGIPYRFVSRNPKKGAFSYTDLNQELIEKHTVIVNCTPLGTYPEIARKPNIPYEFISTHHLLFDLIYNPDKTAFLKAGEVKGAQIKNGDKMLTLQAEKAWEIWNS